MLPAFLIPGTYRLAHYAVSVIGVGVGLQAHLGTSGAQSIHQVGDESIREVLHSATRLVLGAHALCRIHRLDLVSISHAVGFKSTISHFVGRILTRSDRSIDSKVTSFGHKEHRSHISALGSSNTLGPPVEWHSRALLDHCQALSARALLHHIRRSIRALCWHDLPPTSGILTGGIVVGSDHHPSKIHPGTQSHQV